MLKPQSPSPLRAVVTPSVSADMHAHGQVGPASVASCAESLSAVVDRLLAEGDDDTLPTPTPLLQAVARVADDSPQAVDALLDVVDHLSQRADALDDESWQRQRIDVLEQHGNFAVIKALQPAAASQPETLAAAYGPHRSVPALDALCEAASNASVRHPALLSLQVQHLACNASVAALSLAQYGDPSGRDAIVAQLERELLRWQKTEASTTASFDMGTLHIEGMLEALDAFEPPLPADLRHTAEAVVNKTRGKMGALHALLHEGLQLNP